MQSLKQEWSDFKVRQREKRFVFLRCSNVARKLRYPELFDLLLIATKLLNKITRTWTGIFLHVFSASHVMKSFS
jgi:hypothetical protein